MQLTTVHSIEGSADHCWTIIAEQFGDTADWSSSMSSSRLDGDVLEVGTVRIGQVGKRQLRERVTRLDRANRIFAYELLDPPGFVESATNIWTITPDGPDRCTIKSELDMSLHRLATPLVPLLKLALKRQLAAAVEEFRCFAETGTPHERTL